MKNRIGWCNLTWNPVWGCRNNCPYCYARAMAKRFWRQRYEEEFQYYCKVHPDWVWTGDRLTGLKSFKPTWLEANFNKKLPLKPQRIFVGSMSEIYYWDEEWIEMVIERVKQYPQHTFQFLTEHPQIYSEWVWPKNCWLGITIIRTPKYPEPDRWSFIEFKRNNLYNLKFVCFEPLLENINLSYYLDLTAINWVIVGAETGNRRDKIIPNKEWLLYIIKYCDLHKIPIYIKDNLLKYYPKFGYMKEFPGVK